MVSKQGICLLVLDGQERLDCYSQQLMSMKATGSRWFSVTAIPLEGTDLPMFPQMFLESRLRLDLGAIIDFLPPKQPSCRSWDLEQWYFVIVWLTFSSWAYHWLVAGANNTEMVAWLNCNGHRITRDRRRRILRASHLSYNTEGFRSWHPMV